MISARKHVNRTSTVATSSSSAARDTCAARSGFGSTCQHSVSTVTSSSRTMTVGRYYLLGSFERPIYQIMKIHFFLPSVFAKSWSKAVGALRGVVALPARSCSSGTTSSTLVPPTGYLRFSRKELDLYATISKQYFTNQHSTTVILHSTIISCLHNPLVKSSCTAKPIKFCKGVSISFCHKP